MCAILQALEIAHASTHINDSMKSLFTLICSTDSPTRDACVRFINLFIVDRVLEPRTLIERIDKIDIPPISLLQSYVE